MANENSWPKKSDIALLPLRESLTLPTLPCCAVLTIRLATHPGSGHGDTEYSPLMHVEHLLDLGLMTGAITGLVVPPSGQGSITLTEQQHINNVFKNMECSDGQYIFSDLESFIWKDNIIDAFVAMTYS